MRLRTLLPTVALLFALPALARDNPRPITPPSPSVQTRKAFSVADLVVPVSESNAAAQRQKNVDALVRVVTNSVRPYTWAVNGGTGRVEFDEQGLALVVHNTPAVLADVKRMLDTLRQAQGAQIVYELRVLKTRSGFSDRIKVQLSPGTELTDAQLRRLLDAAQGERETNILMAPKVTAFDGQSVTVRTGDERSFVTGGETAKSHGQVVLVPKSTSVFLGNVIELSGTAAPDDKSVQLRARFTRTYLNGEPEQLPVVTQVTPIFEGGSQGSPVPITQHLQAPDIKTEKIDKTATVPANGTVVLGGWKEPADPKPGKAPKLLPGKEAPAGYDVVVLATARVLRPDAIDGTASRVYKLRNVAAVDVARAINDYAKAAKFGALVVGDILSNSVCVKCPAAEQARIAELILALDKDVPMVVVQALVLEVPAGFMVKNGLTDGTEPSCVLSPREVQMFNALLRAAKEKGECDVLSRPQLRLSDGKPGLVQVGQLFPVTTAAGNVDHKHAGVTLRVTPDIAPDGKSVKLTAELQHTKVQVNEAATGAVVPAAGKSAPTFLTQEAGGSVAVPLGHAVVFTAAHAEYNHALAAVAQRLCGRPTQALVVLTPHIVQVEAKPAGK